MFLRRENPKIRALLQTLAIPLALVFFWASDRQMRTEAKEQAAAGQVADVHANFSGVWTQYPHISGGSGFADFSFSKDEPPMTPWAEAKYKAAKPVHTGGYKGASDDTTLNCFPAGVPRIYLFNFPSEIFQVPGRVLIVYEFGHYIRQIYTDGRQHPKDLNPTWMGDSIGKWEGDALVVDTTGFNDKTWLDQVTPIRNCHLIERIRKTAPDIVANRLYIRRPESLHAPVDCDKAVQAAPRLAHS